VKQKSSLMGAFFTSRGVSLRETPSFIKFQWFACDFGILANITR